MQKFSLTSIVRPETMITVIDIGASFVGEAPPYEGLVQAGLARLIGFEPNREACDQLNARYGSPHAFFPYFIGDGTPQVFQETNWVATGSLFTPNKPVLDKFQNLYELMTPLARHPVETTRLDDIAGIDDADFIKIDVQGAELMVFEGAQELLEKVVAIQTEVEFQELYERQPLFADVDTWLRARDFMFHRFLGFGTRCIKPWVLNKDAYQGPHQLWADAVYTRNWIHPEAIVTDKLIKLAVLMHDIFNVPDLAWYVLKLVDARTGGSCAVQYQQRLAQAAAAGS